MFSRLLDIAGVGNIRWKRIVDVFRLKYPAIDVWSDYSDTPPAAFLAWRSIVVIR